jgi:hypothetical protein
VGQDVIVRVIINRLRIEIDKFGFRNQKKSQAQQANKGYESVRTSVDPKEDKAQRLAQKGQKKDANMNKAKARIQQQNRPVVLKPIELLQFSMKAELKEKPILILSTVFFLTLLVSAFILRATEMPRDEAITKISTGFKDYGNAIWCTFITVMTSKQPYHVLTV